MNNIVTTLTIVLLTTATLTLAECATAPEQVAAIARRGR